MGFVLISNFGIQGIEHRLQNVKWIFYEAGIHTSATMGEDNFSAYLIPTEMSCQAFREQLIQIWNLTPDLSVPDLSQFYYQDKLNIRIYINSKEGSEYLSIEIRKFRYLETYFDEESFELIQMLDRKLASFQLKYFAYEYLTDPIYGRHFVGRDILKPAAKYGIWPPKEQWKTYSEAVQPSAPTTIAIPLAAHKNKKSLLKRIVSFFDS